MTKQSVIAIDPGYDRVGIAVLSGEELLHSECFTPNTKEFPLRLQAVHDRIRAVIEEHRPSAMALEKLFFSKNQTTAMRVAEARGVTILAAAEAGVPLFEYSPQEVKIAVTGVGNADKTGVIRMVEQIMKLPPRKRHDDEYDAIALGLAHQAHARLSTALSTSAD